MGDRVRVTGFAAPAAFAAALTACDLAVNLRYPSAGETSASLLRLLAAGRGAVVSDYAQFAELPADAVVRVPCGDGEEEALAALLPGLLADREGLARRGEAARELVRRRHDPAAAAAAVAAACTELAARRPPGDRPARPAPATTVACRHLGAEIVVEGAAGPWPPGSRRRLELRVRNGGACRWLAARRGPGGVAFAVAVESAGGDPEPRRPWLPLPVDLDPGEAAVLPFTLRRPLGPARLRVAPLVLAGWAGTRVERPGGAWEGELG